MEMESVDEAEGDCGRKSCLILRKLEQSGRQPRF